MDHLAPAASSAGMARSAEGCRLGSFAGVALALAGLLVAFGAQAQSAKLVLVLSSFDSTSPTTLMFARTLSKTLGAEFPGKVNVYTEFLDTAHFPTISYTLRPYILAKYADRRPDLIVAIGQSALEFAAANPLGSAPVLFSIIPKGWPIPPGRITGITSDWNFIKTAELALQMVPTARRLAVISGANTFDRSLRRRAMDDIRMIAERVEVVDLAALPFNTLLERVASLPADTIALYSSITVDGTGQGYTSREALKIVAEHSSAPIFSISDTYIGSGMVGGYVTSYSKMGEELARLAVGILSNPNAALPPVLHRPGTGFVMDARQMRRWRLSSANLPADTEVIPEEPSLWALYRTYMLAALAVVLFQAATMAILIVQDARRRRAEARLRASEERMALAALAASIGFWGRDEQHDHVWASPECLAMLGLPPGTSLTDAVLLAAVHPEDLDSVRRWAAGIVSHSQAPEIEFRVVRPDGSVAWLRVIGRGVMDKDGKTPRKTGVMRDVTAGKQAELEVAHQRGSVAHLSRVSMLGEMSGALAHEISQPLTAIVANAQAGMRLLDRPDPDLTETVAILADIAGDGARAGAVIQRLRSLLKKAPASNTLINLNELTTATLAFCHSDLIIRAVIARTIIADDAPIVLGDAVQLQQMLINLIINAAEAMIDCPAAARQLTVSTALDAGGYAMITVTDRGHGFSADVQQRLYEPFFTTKPTGLGLGLSICRTIVASHGGSLSFVNADGGGTSVILSLPLDRGTIREHQQRDSIYS